MLSLLSHSFQWRYLLHKFNLDFYVFMLMTPRFTLLPHQVVQIIILNLVLFNHHLAVCLPSEHKHMNHILKLSFISVHFWSDTHVYHPDETTVMFSLQAFQIATLLLNLAKNTTARIRIKNKSTRNTNSVFTSVAPFAFLVGKIFLT